MSDFRKALLWTAIPIIVLSVVSMTRIFFGLFWFAPLGLLVLAILACIGFAIAHKRQIATGILAGIGIGIVGLGLTCFAQISGIRF